MIALLDDLSVRKSCLTVYEVTGGSESPARLAFDVPAFGVG
jgi:hypothetical protein